MRLKKPCILFIFFILVNFGQMSAQSFEEIEAPKTPKTEKPVRIGTGVGYSFLGYREETDLPLNRYMDNLNFNLNINIEKNKFLYLLNFSFLIGDTDPLQIDNDDNLYSYYQREAVFLRLFLENALDYRLWGNDVFPGYLGGAIRGDLYYSIFRESNYYSFTAVCSLSAHVTQKWIINAKNELVFSVGFPFFGYAFRPPYYGLLYAPLDSENRIISLHNYRAVFGDLKYHYQLNGLLSFYFGLGFELSQITFPQERRDALFSINAGIAFSF